MKDYCTTKTYTIQKIVKTKDGWNLFPKEQEGAIFISSVNYTGKMPSNFRIFFTRPKLTVMYIAGNFMVSAVLGENKLFEISEEDLPSAIKNWITKISELKEKARLAREQEKQHIQEAVMEYIEKLDVPSYIEFENCIFELSVCMRIPLLFHLYKGLLQPEFLYLHYKICQIAEMVYRHHVRDMNKYSEITFADFEFLPCLCEFPPYFYPKKEYTELCIEVENLMRNVLPPIEDDFWKDTLTEKFAGF